MEVLTYIKEAESAYLALWQSTNELEKNKQAVEAAKQALEAAKEEYSKAKQANEGVKGNYDACIEDCVARNDALSKTKLKKTVEDRVQQLVELGIVEDRVDSNAASEKPRRGRRKKKVTTQEPTPDATMNSSASPDQSNHPAPSQPPQETSEETATSGTPSTGDNDVGSEKPVEESNSNSPESTVTAGEETVQADASEEPKYMATENDPPLPTDDFDMDENIVEGGSETDTVESESDPEPEPNVAAQSKKDFTVPSFLDF